MDRITVEFSADALKGNTLSGMAHVFGTRAKVGGRYESMAPTAFARVLADPATDVRAFYQHNPALLLGRQGSGTLRVSSEREGLAFSLDLPETSYAEDLKALVKRGDLNGMSFGFLPGKYSLGKAEDGTQVRTHTDVQSLIEISPVSLPAFDGTALQLHSVDLGGLESQLVLARHRVHMRSN